MDREGKSQKPGPKKTTLRGGYIYITYKISRQNPTQSAPETYAVLTMDYKLKIRTRNNELILRRFPGIAHRPGVHQTKLMRAPTARPQL
jgi:hypothetical protein